MMHSHNRLGKIVEGICGVLVDPLVIKKAAPLLKKKQSLQNDNVTLKQQLEDVRNEVSQLKDNMKEIKQILVEGQYETNPIPPSASRSNKASVANPVEYGHVILVPHGQPRKPDVKSLEMARQVAVEVTSIESRKI